MRPLKEVSSMPKGRKEPTMATTGTITITTDIAQANAVTHSGVFHGDDVFATALLAFVLPEVKVARVFKLNEVNPDAVVYDTGMVYDPEKNRFDHHMQSFEEAYADGIKLSSFGLLWRQYGNQVLSNLGLEENLIHAAWGMVLNDLVKGVDAHDNGQVPPSNPRTMTVSMAISQFNPNWDSDFYPNEGFIMAVNFAMVVLENTLRSAISRAKGKAVVEEAISNASDGIMELPYFVPWQGILSHSASPKAQDILYVVFPSNRGGYSVQGVKVNPASGNDRRKPLPASWAGLNGEALADVSGVEDATFCHVARFICSASSRKGALRLAKLAIAG